jgi:hypothetical protein
MQKGEQVTGLLVDDEEVDVMGVQRAFQHSQLKNKIIVAYDGYDALSKLRSGHSVSTVQLP